MIKFLDLKKINAPFENDFQDKLKSVVDNGWYILGKEVETFEKAYATYCNTKYCIGVGNGLDALILILKGYIALGKLQKGDEVLVPANTYIASILAILQADLIPVLIEPRLETYNLNPDLISEKISSKTKAILVVHLYGQLCEMDQINTIANIHDLLVVEDAAQSQGARCNQKSETRIPNAAVAHSFYPGKNLGALGDGGAVTTNDQDLAKMIKMMRNYGSSEKYKNEVVGVNSRLDELQAAFLNVKLPFLVSDNLIRQAIAKRYLAEIKNDKITLPFWNYSSNHVFHLFVIRTKDRNELQQYLLEKGIETMIHYPIPPHQQMALQEFRNLRLPITEKIHREVLSLPLHPKLEETEITHIIQVVNSY